VCVCVLHAAVARSSSDGVAIFYALPVLRMATTIALAYLSE